MRLREFYDQDWSAKESADAPVEVDSTFDQRTRRIKEALKPLLVTRPPETIRVLDASCGNGSFVSFMRQMGLTAAGIDIAWSAARRSKQANRDASILVASAEGRLPFAAESFDAIWFGETLAQVFDGHATLSEFNRILRPRGRLILTTPYHGLVKNLAIVLFAFHTHFFPDNCRLRFYDRRGLEESLVWAGFEPYLWRGIGRSWPFWKSFFVVARKAGLPGSPPMRLRPR